MFVSSGVAGASARPGTGCVALRSSFCGAPVRAAAPTPAQRPQFAFDVDTTFFVEAAGGKKAKAGKGGSKRGGDGKRADSAPAPSSKPGRSASAVPKPAERAAAAAEPEAVPAELRAASPEAEAAAAEMPKPAPAAAGAAGEAAGAGAGEEERPRARRRAAADLKPLPEMPAFIKAAETDTRQLEQDFSGLVSTTGKEEEYVVPAAECRGALPKELRGLLLRNGPGLVDVGKARLHPLDGHGFVSSLEFDGASVRVRSAFVRTPTYEAESRTGRRAPRPLIASFPSLSAAERGGRRVASRGFASTRGPLSAFDTAARPVANVACVKWGGRLLATGEGHRPYGLEAGTLGTRGEEDLGGALGKREALLPHLKPVGGRLVAVALEEGRLSTRVRTLEFDPAWKLVDSQYQELSVGGANFHDAAVTPKYVLLFQNSTSTFAPRYAAYLLGLTTRAAALRWDPEQPFQIFVLPREPRNHRRLQTEATYLSRVGNAFDVEEEAAERDASGIGLGGAGERVQFDAIAYEEYEPGNVDPARPRTVPRGGLYRFTVNIQRATVLKRPLTDLACDSPTFNPEYAGRRSRFVYAAACPDPKRTFPFQSVVKCDAEVIGRSAVVGRWDAGPREFVSEAAFAPRPGAAAEDDGWLLCFVHDAAARTARLVVLDAADLARGPLAEVPLRSPLPLTNRASWAPK